MGDLAFKDLVVEYSSGGYAVRPIDGLNLDVAAGLAGDSAGAERVREDDAAVVPRRHPATHVRGRSSSATSTSPRSTAAALSKYRRDTVGIVFQAFNLVPSLTALENVMVPLRAARMSRRAARERAEELLARVGLKDRMRHRPGDLSAAGSSSASRWRGRSRWIRRCCWPTSRPRTWTSFRSRRCCG